MRCRGPWNHDCKCKRFKKISVHSIYSILLTPTLICCGFQFGTDFAELNINEDFALWFNETMSRNMIIYIECHYERKSLQNIGLYANIRYKRPNVWLRKQTLIVLVYFFIQSNQLTPDCLSNSWFSGCWNNTIVTSKGYYVHL